MFIISSQHGVLSTKLDYAGLLLETLRITVLHTPYEFHHFKCQSLCLCLLEIVDVFSKKVDGNVVYCP